MAEFKPLFTTTDASGVARRLMLAGWFKIRRITGVGGRYCFGSVERLNMSPEYAKEFYDQAWSQRITCVVENGYLYLDIRA